jgi:hypothetical protein
LKNFHESSHNVPIVPILIATGASASPSLSLQADSDSVYRPVSIPPADLRRTINLTLQSVEGERIDQQRWSCSSYRPTPTIIEAARALYARHSVDACSIRRGGPQSPPHLVPHRGTGG